MFSFDFTLYLSLLLFTPLVFSGVDLWAQSIMELLCFAAFLTHFYGNEKHKKLYVVPGIVPLFCFLSYLLIQILPLPPGLVRVVSPARYQLAMETVGLAGPLPWLTLSISPKDTLDEWIRYTAYVSFYILAIQLLADAGRLRKTVFVVVAAGVIIAIEAILQKYLGAEKIFWLRDAVPSAFMGPFPYRNHYSAFMGMITSVALAIFLYKIHKVNHPANLRQRFFELFSFHPGNNSFLLGLGSLVMAASIFASLSRGGSISASVAILTLIIAMRLRYRRQSMLWGGMFFGICTALIVGWSSWDKLDARFGRMITTGGNLTDGRLKYWQDCTAMLSDYFLTGAGWGTFDKIFPTYRTQVGNFFVHNAHNHYIEAMADGGIIGLAIICWFLVTVTIALFRTLSRRKDSYSFHLVYGCLAGLLDLFLHSMVDSHFRNPAITLYFFFFIALVLSAAHTRHQNDPLFTFLPQWKGKWINFGLVLTITSLSIACIAVRTIEFITLAKLITPFQGDWSNQPPRERVLHRGAELESATGVTSLEPKLRNGTNPPILFEEKASLPKISQDVLADLHNLVALAPFDAYLNYEIANAASQNGDISTAKRHFLSAIHMNPTQATFLESYARFLAHEGESSLAGKYFLQSIRRDRSSPQRRRAYATFLFTNAPAKGLLEMREVLAMAPAANKTDILLLADAGFSDVDIRRCLPERMAPQLTFAEYLEKKGDNDQAETVIHESLAMVDKEPKLQAGYFHRAQAFFSRRKNDEAALSILRKGIELLPRDTGLRVLAGNIYRRMKLPQQALDCYRQALAIDPATPKVRKLIDEVKAIAQD